MYCENLMDLPESSGQRSFTKTKSNELCGVEATQHDHALGFGTTYGYLCHLRAPTMQTARGDNGEPANCSR